MSIDRGWSTVVCVASGPSLTDEQCSIVDVARMAGRCRIVVVNDNWARIPDADALIAIDGHWWTAPINETVRDVAKVPSLPNAEAVSMAFRGECWSRVPLREPDGTLNRVEKAQAEVLQRYPFIRQVPAGRFEGMPVDGQIGMGGNTGYAAIGLAYLFGARQIILIGYDMSRGDGLNHGKAHWFGDHQKPLTQGTPTSWIRRYETLVPDAIARGVRIINCTIRTALECFPRADVAATLAASP